MDPIAAKAVAENESYQNGLLNQPEL